MTHVTFGRRDEEVDVTHKVWIIFNNESGRVIAFDKLPPSTMGKPVNAVVIDLITTGWEELERRKVTL
jgi:hypothetical protein